MVHRITPYLLNASTNLHADCRVEPQMNTVSAQYAMYTLAQRCTLKGVRENVKCRILLNC